MKNIRIWIVLILILIAGTGFTRYTSRYVSIHQSETTREAAGSVSEELSTQTETTELTTVSSYLTRLEDLDQEIERMRNREKETTAGYAAVKVRTENEWRLWQAEMDRVLDVLEKQLDVETRETLFQEQRDWVRDRESKAIMAATKQSGAALEEVEYNRSLGAETRARVYELVRRYENILQ